MSEVWRAKAFGSLAKRAIGTFVVIAGTRCAAEAEPHAWCRDTPLGPDTISLSPEDIPCAERTMRGISERGAQSEVEDADCLGFWRVAWIKNRLHPYRELAPSVS